MEQTLSEKGRLTRRKILIAAAKAVANHGIEHASISQIAKTGRISRSLIPYYLEKKDRLLIQIAQFVIEEAYGYFQSTAESIRCTTALPRGLEMRIRLNYEFFSANPHYSKCFMLFLYRCSYDDECRKFNTLVVQNACLALEQSLEPLQLKDSARAASSIYRFMNSAMQQKHAVAEYRKPLPLETWIQDLLKEIEYFLAGSPKAGKRSV